MWIVWIQVNEASSTWMVRKSAANTLRFVGTLSLERPSHRNLGAPCFFTSRTQNRDNYLKIGYAARFAPVFSISSLCGISIKPLFLQHFYPFSPLSFALARVAGF